MYPELEQFEQLRLEFDEQISQLQKQQKALEQEKAALTRQYNEALSRVVYEHDPESAVKMARLKEEQQEVNTRLKETKLEIEEAQVRKKERLTGVLDALKKGRDREIAAARRKMMTKKEELKRFRAEYLLFIQQIAEIRQYARDVDRAFKKTAKTITPQFDQEPFSFPHLNLHNPYGKEEALGILETEVQQVYRSGKLPEWVEAYTGSNAGK